MDKNVEYRMKKEWIIDDLAEGFRLISSFLFLHLEKKKIAYEIIS